MSKFDERHLMIVDSCDSCKYCIASYLAYTADKPSLGVSHYHFCMVDGVSREERLLAATEVCSLMKEDIPTECSTELIRILKLDETNPDFRRSPRLVSQLNCCEFYEQSKQKEEQEDE